MGFSGMVEMFLMKAVARVLFVLLMAISMLTMVSAAPVAGHILSINGAGWVEAVAQREAVGGAEVFQGETLVTGEDGRMQVKFVDHGLVSLRPDTRFRIDAFEFEPGGGGGRSFFSLAKGGFRAVTGRIGKLQPEKYRISTPVATLGVRGTDFGAILCAATCAAAFKTVSPGLYARVNQGAIVVQQAGREMLVKAGQVVYIRDSATLPALLSEPPPESFWSLSGRAASMAGLSVSVPAVVGGAALVALPFAVTSENNDNDAPQSPEL